MDNPAMKTCTKCGAGKDRSEFTSHARMADGLRGECKDCAKAYKAEYCRLHQEEIKKYQAEYRRKNKGKLKMINAEYRRKNKGKLKAYRTEYNQLPYVKKANCANVKKYKTANPEKVKARIAMYWRKNIDRLRLERTERNNTPQARAEAVRRSIQYKKDHPRRIAAYRKVSDAVKKGNLVKPLICSMCGEEKKIVAHHHSYAKPLEVQWVCDACHYQIHKDLKALEQA